MLVLDEVVQGGDPVQPAEAGLAVAALLEFVVDLGPVVDPHGAGADLPRHPEGTRDLAGPDPGRQPVLAAVGQGDALLLVLEYLQGQHRSEGFLLHDVQVRIIDLQQGRTVEGAGRQLALGYRAAADHHPRAGGDGLAYGSLDALDVGLVDQRPHVAARVRRRPHAQVFQALRQAFA